MEGNNYNKNANHIPGFGTIINVNKMFVMKDKKSYKMLHVLIAHHSPKYQPMERNVFHLSANKIRFSCHQEYAKIV